MPGFRVQGHIYRSGSLWIEFQLIEIDEVMRQRGDSTFSEKCRVQTNSCSSADIDSIKSRVITEDMAKYALLVYSRCCNALMLDDLSAQYNIMAKVYLTSPEPLKNCCNFLYSNFKNSNTIGILATFPP